MAKYTIIGLIKEEMYPDHLRLVVAYRDNESGDEQYFVSQINKNYEGADYIAVLLKYSYDVGGHELAQSLEHYLKWTKSPWATSMKVETVNVAEFDKPMWGWEKVSLPNVMVTHKMKITMEGAPEYHEGGYVNKYEYSNGGIIGANHFQPKYHSNVAPRGLSSLPGLGAVVKHPGSLDNLCKIYNHISLKTMIIHLNDYHKWTREQIADWLDEISDPTGETGPDLRFGAEHDKVESENPCEEIKSDHTEHVHVSFEDISYNALKQMQAEIKIDKINPELFKLLTGETNEQD